MLRIKALIRMSINNKVTRFIIIGSCAAIVQFVLTLILIKLNILPALAVGLAFLTTLIVTYFAQKNITFLNNEKHGVIFYRYLLAQCIALVNAAIFARYTYYLFSAEDFLFSLVVTIYSGALSFLLCYFWVFKSKRY